MSNLVHQTVTAVFHGSDIPTMVAQVYCSDDEIGRRTAMRAAHEHASQAGKQVKIIACSHDGAIGWDVECVEAS